METKYRPLLTEPGEPLLLANSAVHVYERFAEWLALTGMPADRVASSPLCAVPLPIYTADLEPGRTRQFSDIPAGLLWHPLFWLPARIADRYDLSNPHDGHRVESDDERAARLAFELTAAGLYHPDHGWVDVLAAYGIDVEDDFDLARIQEWQQGSADEVLDSIDLGPALLVQQDPHWALGSTLPLWPALQGSAWAFMSDSLLFMLEEAQEQGPDQPLDAVRRLLRHVSVLASVMLSAVPVKGEPETAAEFWARIELEATDGHYSTAAEVLNGPVEEAREWLDLTREAYRDSAEQLRDALTV